MAGFRESLELDISAALQRVGQVESRLTQASQTFKVSLAKSLDDLSQTFQLEINADTAGLQRQIDAAIRQQTVVVDAETTGVTAEVDRAIDAVDATVPVDADTAPAVESLHTFEREVEGTALRAARQFGGVFAGVALTAGIHRVIDAASDLNESINITQVTFGDAADEIDRFAENAATSIGQSERAARDATASFGGLLQNVGFTASAAADVSITLTRLGSDLASSFNTEPAEAVDALKSALIGENEPLRAYNVLLNEAKIQQEAVRLGLVDTIGPLNDNAKAQSTLSIILQQTARYQGDFANTAENAANAARTSAAQVEDSAASFGEAVTPVYAKVVQVVGDMAEVFGALPGPVQTGLIALAGVAALAGPISSVVTIVTTLTAARAASAAAAAVEATATGAATVAFQAEAVSLAQATAAATALTTALEANAVAQGTAGAAAAAGGGLRAALAGFSGTALGTGLSGAVAVAAPLTVMAAASRDAASGVDQANEAIGDFIDRSDFDPATGSLADLRDEIDRVNNAGQTLQTEFNNTGIAEGQLRGRINAATRALNPYAEGLADLATRVEDLAAAEGISADQALRRIQNEEAGIPVGQMTEAQLRARANVVDQVVSATQRLIDKQTELYSQANTSAQTELNLQSALLDTRDALDNADEAWAQYGSGSEEAQRAVIAATQAAIRQSEAAVADAEAHNGRIQLSAKETADIQIAQLTSVARTLDPSSDIRRNLEDYIFELANVPNQIATEVLTNLKFSVAGADTRVDLVVQSGQVIKFAGGLNEGPVFAGNPFRGNEAGPGEIFVSRLDGMVVNDAQQAAIQAAFGGHPAGGGVTFGDINVDARGSDPDEVVRRINTRTRFALARGVR